MKMSKGVLIIALLSISACLGNEISDQIEDQLFNHPSSTINLALVGPPDWTQVCVLPPYTRNEGTKEILGFEWDSERNTSIAGSDGVNVLVFIRNKAIVTYAEHPRDKGDFAELRPRCLHRDKSELVRKTKESGWIYLERPEN